MKIEPHVGIEGVVDGDAPLYRDPVLQTRYYNYYFSYGLHFCPRSIFEIGVRRGYTAYYLLKGAKAGGVSVERYDGIDLETYATGSTAYARRLLSPLAKRTDIKLGDSHKLARLPTSYDLIHIDGDHTREGKLADLNLAFTALNPGGVIVVDDCYRDGGPKQVVYDATMFFIESKKLHMQYIAPLCGSTINPISGHILIHHEPKL